MQFETWSKGIAGLEADCLVVGLFEEGQLGGEARAVDSACGGRLKRLLGRGDFPGKLAETLLLADLPGIGATRVLLTGLGPKKGYGRKAWRKAWGAAVAALTKTGIESAALAIELPAPIFSCLPPLIFSKLFFQCFPGGVFSLCGWCHGNFTISFGNFLARTWMLMFCMFH